jgi:hypothetical protein
VKFCTQKKDGPERYCNLRKVIGLIREGISLNQFFIIYFIWLCNPPRSKFKIKASHVLFLLVFFLLHLFSPLLGWRNYGMM